MLATAAMEATTREAANDVHSRLNPCTIHPLRPRSVTEAQALVRRCTRERAPLALMGARHAMGGQQFLSDGRVLDTGALGRVLAFDPARGLVTVEAGIRWPALLAWLRSEPANTEGWTIRQKQTGADDFSLGGALAANIHGRGLSFRPFVDDVESFTLITAAGELREVDRSSEPELFALVAGGYGLFGLVVRITLRLVRRTTLRRDVRLLRSAGLMAAFERALEDGCTYGDFQFAIDPDAPSDFLQQGILSCYRPVPGATPDPNPRSLQPRDFAHLLLLAHHDPARAFAEYSEHYLASDGQLYASDTQQSGVYLGDYHAAIDTHLGHAGSEMITELFVPRHLLADFLGACAERLRREGAQPVYGTVRLVEEDRDSFLAWARRSWACVVFNLHVRHDPPGLTAARRAFRALIDLALERSGSFYLTYHRWATREQIEAAHPRFADFLRAKQQHDPDERWSSDWYRHQRRLFA